MQLDDTKDRRKYTTVALLVEEMVALERFQPTDPNINIKKVSSFDYFMKKLYKPKENI